MKYLHKILKLASDFEKKISPKEIELINAELGSGPKPNWSYYKVMGTALGSPFAGMLSFDDEGDIEYQSIIGGNILDMVETFPPSPENQGAIPLKVWWEFLDDVQKECHKHSTSIKSLKEFN